MMLSIISYHGLGYMEVSVLCQESTEQRKKSFVELKMPCLGAPLTLAQCEHFEGESPPLERERERERGQAFGKLTLAALPLQRKTNNVVRWAT